MSAAIEDLPPQLRSMRQEDVPAVAALEQAAYDFPWSAGIFRDCLLAGYTAVILESEAAVVGYAVMSVAAGEAHLLNICLERHLRDHMLELAVQAGAERLYLEVRPSNKAAMRMYRSAGFEVIGIRRGYYRASEGNEDAVIFVRRIDTPA